MGVVSTIGVEKFPVQGGFLGTRCEVYFNYDTSRWVHGTIVRDDRSPPNRTIIQLDDGRYVLASECHYQPARPSSQGTI